MQNNEKMIEGMRKRLCGKTIQIIEMNGEPQYSGKVGVVEFIDDIGQIFGTWGGCAIIPNVDRYKILNEA